MEQFLNGCCSNNIARLSFAPPQGIVSLLLSFHLHYYFSALSEAALQNNYLNFCSNSWRATCNFQGGAICADNGANVEIHDSSFERNTVTDWVSHSDAVRESSLKISLQFPADATTRVSLTRHRSFNIARIGVNQKGTCKSTLQLSFELLFSCIG
jgi:hypothetical protein